jgi:ABC-type phosphate transport system substrate-binding protein
VNIQGIGSTLQKVAQETWTGREVPFGLPLGAFPHVPTTKTGYYKACEPKAQPPTVSYTGTGAGAALTAFRFLGVGAINTNVHYIGTEAPPTAAMIANAEAVAGGAKPVIVPVSQTAISVVVHPPANCVFKAGKGITWGELNKVFGGNGITAWNQFSNIEATVAGACNAAITRVVRAEASGVTYQFKNYLSVLETTLAAEAPPCVTAGVGTWGELKSISATGTPNTVWPQCMGGTAVVTAEGDGALAQKVAATEGTIGYSALPNAKAKGATSALLQNGVVVGIARYASPENAVNGTARCLTPRYTVPVAGRRGAGAGESVDWSQVFGAQPQIGGTEYPLCTLAFDVGWNNYDLG